MGHASPPPPEVIQLLRTIEEATARACSQGREVLRVGAFLATFHPTSDMIWINCALPLSGTDSPDGGETDLGDDIAGLREAYRQRRRVLRLEFFEHLWPTLGPALEREGLALQARMPLMVCRAADFVPVTGYGVEVSWVDDTADDATIVQFLSTAYRSFGERTDLGAEQIREQRMALSEGRYRTVIARLDSTVAGVGSMTLANDELVGVGTLPEFRRRGVAAAVCGILLQDYFAGGKELVWLSAGDAPAAALYRKLGFRVVGDQLNYIDKDALATATGLEPRPS